MSNVNVVAPRTVTPAAPAAAPAICAAPASKPTIAGDSFTRSSAVAAQLPAIATGKKLSIQKGSSFKGVGFGGNAIVNQADGKVLDLTVDASVFKIFHPKVHLRFETQPDGSVRFLGERQDNGKPQQGVPNKVGTSFKVVSSEPGHTVFQADNGKTVDLSSDASGKLTISYDAYQIALKG